MHITAFVIAVLFIDLHIAAQYLITEDETETALRRVESDQRLLQFRAKKEQPLLLVALNETAPLSFNLSYNSKEANKNSVVAYNPLLYSPCTLKCKHQGVVG